MELPQAQTLAEELVFSVRPFCARAEIAGSIRRKKPQVKDIEIVAIVRDWLGLFLSLEAHGEFIKPGVPEITPWPPKVGAKYLRMMLSSGIKLDVFIGTEDNWGALFCMRTGSGVGPDGNPMSGFVPAMFGRWKKVSDGGKMSNCLPTRPDGTQVPVPEEEDFFRLLGVDWIPPENRTSSKDVHRVRGFTL